MDLAVLEPASYLIGSVGVLLGAVYYVFSVHDARANIKATLETRQATLFTNLFSHYNTREFLEDYLAVIGTEYDSLEDWYRKYVFKDGLKASIYPAWIRVGRYFDGAGILVRSGLIDSGLANELFRELVIQSWESMRLWVYENRKRTRNDTIWRNFEYLYCEVKKSLPDAMTHDEMIKAGHVFLDEVDCSG